MEEVELCLPDEALRGLEAHSHNSLSVCVMESNAGAVRRTAMLFIHPRSLLIIQSHILLLESMYFCAVVCM